MRLALFASTALVCLLPATGFAQQVSGLYIGAGAGLNVMQNEHVSQTTVFGPITTTTNNSFFGSRPVLTTRTFPPAAFSNRGQASYGVGAVGVGSVGYGLGNGLRAEVEGNYRYNERRFATAVQQKGGALVNLLYDLDVGLPWMFPYVGAGAGYEWVDRGQTLTRTSGFAYQGILGVGLPIALVPGLSATVEYRFLGLAGTKQSQSSTEAGFSFPGFSQSSTSVKNTVKFSDNYNHSILFGVRYAFNHAPPVVPVPAAAPVPMVQPARTYLVFFDWDRADLTARARQVVTEAAQARTRVAATRIEVQGNADSSGTRSYNQALSLRRAQTVAAELVRDGVPAGAIDIQAFGDTKPLVATAAGVREPQNRRVAIILR